MFISTVKLCNAVDEYIEVVEGKSNNTFTCSGLNAEETVTWVLTDVNSEQWIGTCPQLHPNGTLPACTLGSLPMFSLRRISGMESVIAVDTAKVTDASLFARKRLKCLTTEGSKQTEAICQLDYVYPAEGVKCTVQLNGDVWSVTGYCTISKMYSSSGRYGCWLYQSKTEPSDFTLAGKYSLETSNISGTSYSSGNCRFSTYLPPEGRYNYRVIVTPGSANVSALFLGSDTIYRPSSSPSNNCPQTINEGSKLSCSCFANDLGSPSGRVQWDNTSSAQLIRANVSAADYGTRFTCNIMWNNTATESVTYTLFVMYQPNLVELKINLQSKSVTVNESETVNIVCQANGQPMPTLRLEMDTGREIRVVLGGSVSKTNEKTVLTYTLQGVRVQDTGLYTCLANNGLGRDVSSSTALYVKGPLAAIRGSFSSEKGNYPFINFRGSPESLTFDVMTYETPKQYTFVFLGTDPRAEAVMFPRLGVLKSACVSGDILQKTRCSVTATNVTEDEVGFYNLTLENSMGSLTVTFHLQRFAQDSEGNTGSQSNVQLGLGIGLGIAAVAIIVVAIALICLYKRRRGNRNNDHSNCISENTKEDNDYHSSSTAEPEHAYDAIRSNEMEMRSSYIDLQGYTHCRDEQRKSNVYETPVTTDSRE